MALEIRWKRLVRYVSSEDGAVKLGEPILPEQHMSTDLLALGQSGDLEVEVLEGLDPFLATRTSRKDKVKTLLSPLEAKDVPIIRCIGLNYRSHILEAGRPLPNCPTIFTKPGPAVAGCSEDVPVPKLAQEQCDYEGELTLVIGKDGKDIPAEAALDYVAGYTVGNDVSTRDWQRDPNKAGPVPQWTFSKSFDKYAPIGPCIVSTELLGAAENLVLKTSVNGSERQNGNTSDLHFGVRDIIAFCSQGQTLQKGSLIMTGTPGGVGLFMKPPSFLQDNDVVTVEIDRIGRISNRIKFL